MNDAMPDATPLTQQFLASLATFLTAQHGEPLARPTLPSTLSPTFLDGSNAAPQKSTESHPIEPSPPSVED